MNELNTNKQDIGNWLDCSKRDGTSWINAKVASSIQDQYRSSDGDMIFNAYVYVPGVLGEHMIKTWRKLLRKRTLKNPGLRLPT
jgi:hypothetical protein